MSLLRLLTAGKSLIGVQQETGRYRMTNPKAMPKFGDGTNPFQAKAAKAETEKRQALEALKKARTPDPGPELFDKPAGDIPVVAVESGEVVEAVGPVEQTDKPAAAAAVPADAGRPSVASKPARLNGLISKLGSLKKIWGRRTTGTARRAKELRPVQGEFPLDKIKVVRNDLSESDLEIVPLRSGAAKQPENGGRELPGAREEGAAVSMSGAGRG
jgi:hypothetical protein